MSPLEFFGLIILCLTGCITGYALRWSKKPKHDALLGELEIPCWLESKGEILWHNEAYKTASKNRKIEISVKAAQDIN